MAQLAIYEVLDQYAAARGSHDVEYAVCRMIPSGEVTTIADDDLLYADFESYVKDREAYWRSKGWEIIPQPNGSKKLVPAT